MLLIMFINKIPKCPSDILCVIALFIETPQTLLIHQKREIENRQSEVMYSKNEILVYFYKHLKFEPKGSILYK